MSVLPDLAVTGAVGGAVARHLVAAGVPHRLLVRNPTGAPSLPETTVCTAPYADGEAARRAFAGVRTLLMVSAAESEDRLDQHRAFVEAAADANVQPIVYTGPLPTRRSPWPATTTRPSR